VDEKLISPLTSEPITESFSAENPPHKGGFFVASTVSIHPSSIVVLMGKRQAPKREIKEIRRVGTWGKIQYEHILECGHTEKLLRASRAIRIACSWCVKAEEKDEEFRALIPQVQNITQSFEDINDIDVSSGEIEVSRTRASLASILKIPLEAVHVVAIDSRGVLEIRSAYVFLSAGDIRKIINNGGLN
jgi:hypothetical protein